MKNNFLVTSIILFFAACTNTEIGNSNDIEPNAIAQEIDVMYNEGESPTSRIRFRVSGMNGTTLVLNQPASVSFNNALLKVDSTGFLGAYYEATNLTNGSNTFNYKAKDGKNYENSFDFNGFYLATPLPTKIIKRDGLQLTIKGLKPESKINVVISDTVKTTQDIEDNFILNNDIAIISPALLANLKSGPLKINITHNTTNNLKNVTAEGGKINYIYALKQINATLK